MTVGLAFGACGRRLRSPVSLSCSSSVRFGGRQESPGSQQRFSLAAQAFRAQPRRAKRINAYYVTAAAALALWRNTQDRKDRDEMAKPLPVQVFVDQGGNFSETSSMKAELVPGRWQSIRFDHLEKLGQTAEDAFGWIR